MTRRQLGNALAIALKETEYDLEEAAVAVVRMEAASQRQAEVSARAEQSPANRGIGRRATRRRKEDVADCVPVVTAIAVKNGLTYPELVAGRGSKAIRIRFEVMWSLRQLDPPATYPTIAAALGMSSHQSVIYGVRKHARILASHRDGPALTLLPGGKKAVAS